MDVSEQRSEGGDDEEREEAARHILYHMVKSK